jgi:phage portal protein BeeE
MGFGAAVKDMWERVAGVAAAGGAGESVGERKTAITPLGMNSIFAPFRTTGVQNTLPKPTAANLRRFAETPVARRAINCIKDRIACMDWQIEVRRGAGEDVAGDRAQRAAMLTKALDLPNESDSFRTMIEQVLEDTLVGGFGAAEIETGDAGLPVRLYPVDGASIQVEGRSERPSVCADYGQAGQGIAAAATG